MLHMLNTDMARYVIKRRAPRVVERLRSLPPADICIPAVSRAELLYGLKRLPPEHRLHLGVARFIATVRTLNWDAEAAGHYAEIRHRLTTRGALIGELDMMIAAHSLAVGALLVTNNRRHFERIGEPLVLAGWAE